MKKVICSLILIFSCFGAFSGVILKGSISGLAPTFQNDYNCFDEEQPSSFDFMFCPLTGVEISGLWESKSDEETPLKMIYGANFGYEVTAFYLDGVIGFNKVLKELNNCNLELSVAGLLGPAMGLFYGIMYLDAGIEGNLYFVPKDRTGFFGGIGISDKDLLEIAFYKNYGCTLQNFNIIKVNLTCGLRF